ncbi:C-C motif chemokine 26 [Dasypus novemcinctus]|uniref:C-C motif chemokine 26 n=1 Tax=Dasypus novemcinctus TaxID=9361 RepID=UPI00032907C3|nr:C-C motif chemokine 26 [Dasypus novemcinctus]
MESFPSARGVLLALLLSAHLVHLGAATRGTDVARFCCFQYSHKVLPRNWIRNYEFSRSSCSQPAVIFTTKRGQKVCTNPKEKWVQKYIASLQTQQS